MRVIIAGAAGRMGKTLLRCVAERDDCFLAGALERPDSPYVGLDAGELAGYGRAGVKVVDDANRLGEADVFIDFTQPKATLDHALFAANRRLRMVIGTTGFGERQLNELRRRLEGVPVVMAANFSLGVNLALFLIEKAAAMLDESYDIEILEMHHRHKVDAPSGTALAMGQVAAGARGKALEEAGEFVRHGIVGPRERGTIGFSVIRGGDIVGEHSTMFIGQGERLEVRHVATDRACFANGALHAASWLMHQPAGFYDMRSVLGMA